MELDFENVGLNYTNNTSAKTLAKKDSVDLSAINARVISLNKKYGKTTIQLHKIKQSGRRGPAIALYSLTEFGKETYYKLREELDDEPVKELAG